MKFSYEKYLVWFREKASMLTSLGYSLETKENSTPPRTLLMRITTSQILAELVVWETGATSMMVINKSSGHYDLDRHDIVLMGNEFEKDLGLFFLLVK